MLQIGQVNRLQVTAIDQDGYHLSEGVLLPLKSTDKKHKIGDRLDVFVFTDSDEGLLASFEVPALQVGEIGVLTVKTTEEFGAFLDWNHSKDLFLPHRETTRDIKVGHKVVVGVYVDKEERVAASMRVETFLKKIKPQYEVGEKVDLIVLNPTDLGFKAIINKSHIGMLYENEIFEHLKYAQQLPGYIKKVRDDGKIDLLLQPMGNKGSDDLGQAILAEITRQKGFLAVTDKTAAEEIYNLFGVSKKKFKMALGGLYKKRLITISEDGIRLIEKNT